MKRFFILFVALLVVLTGCARKEPVMDGDNRNRPADTTEAARLWSETELPCSVRYDRMWVYSASAETTDSELITALVQSIKALEIGDPTEIMVTDYTDFLTFTFADGHTTHLEFEEQNWVDGNGIHYHVSGLNQVRQILDELMEE